MRYLIFAAAALYLVWLLWEKRTNDKALSSFRHVILVNGIRGKTDTCRRLDAAFRGAGFAVFTKTTGSQPAYIGTDGAEVPLRRLGGPNIKEQLRMLRLARKQGAEVVILECMAVAPELQRVLQEQMVKAKIGIITNVRYDHPLEMGSTLEEIAESLSLTIPKDGLLFTSDEAFFPYFSALAEQRGSKAILCRDDRGGLYDNEALVSGVFSALGLPAPGCSSVAPREDFGSRREYSLGGKRLINLFPANDPVSSLQGIAALPEELPRTYLYNHRADRPDRLLLFRDRFFPEAPAGQIVLLGEARFPAARLLKKAGFEVTAAKDYKEALALCKTETVIGLGNIKGEAAKLLSLPESEGKGERPS